MAATDVISVSMVDFKGKRGNTAYHVPSGLTDAEITSLMNTLLEALDNITGCKILGIQVTKSLSIAGALALKTDPLAGLDFEKGANFGYDVTDSDYRHTIRVPAMDEGAIVGEEVDLLDVDVAVYNNIVISGVGLALPSNRDGLDIDSTIEGLVTFHKS